MRAAVLYGYLVGDDSDTAGRLGLIRVDYEHGGFVKNNQEKQKDSTIQNVSTSLRMMLASAFFDATRSRMFSYCRIFCILVLMPIKTFCVVLVSQKIQYGNNINENDQTREKRVGSKAMWLYGAGQPNKYNDTTVT